MSTSKPRCAPSAPSPQDRHRTWRRLTSMLALTVVGLFAVGMALAEDDERDDEAGASTLTIARAAWDSREHRLRVSGQGTARAKVTVVNAYSTTQKLGTDSAERNGAWSISKQLPRPVPCRVRATLTDGQTVERAVDKAPADCSPKAPGTGTPPPVTTNQAPTAKANGPYSGKPSVAVRFSSAGSVDPDGSIATYAWTFGDGATSNQANPSHTYATAKTYTVTLKVTDKLGAVSALASTSAVIATVALPPPPSPTACTSSIPEHCNITAYIGPEVCVACHQNQARDMHGSVHYQQGGAFPNVTNIPANFTAAGERPAKAAGDLVATGVNTYCGTHENSPRFTCAGCHVGNGRLPMAQSLFEQLAPASAAAQTQLANIDCLTCHQEVYKRFPDWTASGLGFSNFSLLNLAEDASGALIRSDGGAVLRTGFQGIPNLSVAGDFLFKPAGSDTLPATAPLTPMPLTTLAAAQNVHATTRKSCLNCHAGAGGADGAKRGDLSQEDVNPSVTHDLHMSSAGANLTCADCHTTPGVNGETHRMRGRGLDLRADDVAERFTCEAGGCHNNRPHGDFSNTQGASKDKHAMKVACQTCHIPAYAKAAVGTEIARDWQDPHPSDAACSGRGGWLPREDKGGLGSAALIPSYNWFDGTSEVIYLEESLAGVPTVPLDATIAAKFVGDFAAGDPAYVLGQPNGDVTSATAKLYPMKQHWGKLARNDANNSLVGHSTFEFFRTGSFCRAVALGLGDDPDATCAGTPGTLEMPAGTTAVPVFTYQTINHGVEPTANALGGDSAGCGSCHQALSGGPARLDMAALGYGLRTLPSVVAGSRVTALNGTLNTICTQCHDNESEDRDFNSVHSRHVQKEGKDCAACHNFARPERGLTLSRGDD
ncbi:PKD domain-containing protein [Chromatium okenii]|uniref:PKD domain-containing protein n=1 Tax=Chromatium okenii TaxID=61644 RepID=UPI001902F837|nr:PKD domain-containing protein [Chromatium okenii]